VPQRRLHVGVAQHPPDFLHPRLALDHLDITRRHTTFFALGNPEVMVGVGGDLRQVRDDEGLTLRSRDAREGFSHPHAHFAADALIHFVEHERRDGVVSRQHHLQREHQARQLPTRRASGEGANA